MKRKVSLCAFADEADASLAGQIKALGENGIEHLEIRGVDAVNIANIPVGKASEIREILDGNGISVWSLGSPAGKTDIKNDFAFEREQFKHLMELGNVLGAKCVRLFSFYGTNGDPAFRDEVMYRLSEFISMANDAGIVPCHENEKGIYGDVPERCLDIQRALPGMKSVFDPANYIQCGADTLSAWSMLSEYVYYCHIKDADSDGRVVPAGCGAGHLVEILSDFLSTGDRVLTLEPHLSDFVGLSGLEREGERSAISEYNFKNNREAFDFAVESLKNILDKM